MLIVGRSHAQAQGQIQGKIKYYGKYKINYSEWKYANCIWNNKSKISCGGLLLKRIDR